VGGTLAFWPVGLVEEFVGRGYHVITYDHRDTGLSDHFDDAGVPDLTEVVNALASGLPAPLPYTLDDLADDAAGLLDALGIKKAHVLGASMGGLVATLLAVNHPDKVLSLTPMFPDTTNRELPGPADWVVSLMLGPVPDPTVDREGYITTTVNRFLGTAPDGTRGTGSPGYPPHPGHLRVRTEKELNRRPNPAGVQRHLAATFGAPDLRKKLNELDVPTIVLHGEADMIVPLASGRDTADNIPGAEFLVFPGMSHDFPPALWGAFADSVDKNADRAKSRT
jgi:pimeloyl-ACP methyl ester carboxylesterase